MSADELTEAVARALYEDPEIPACAYSWEELSESLADDWYASAHRAIAAVRKHDANVRADVWDEGAQAAPDFGDGYFIGADPCPECGEFDACGYDAEGRSLIHTDPDPDA